MPETPTLPPLPKRLFDDKNWHQCLLDYRSALFAGGGSTGTVYEYDNCLKRFFRDRKREPDTYTAAEVESFLSLDNPAPSTRNRRLAVLSSFYTFAENYTRQYRKKPRFLVNQESNPTGGFRAVKVAESKRRAFEDDEISTFFNAIPRDSIIGKRDYAFFLYLLLTGRRVAEVTNLQWGDIQQGILADGSPGRWYRWKGKGHREKDDQESLPPPVWTAIQAYLAADGRLDTMRAEDYIWQRTHDLAPSIRHKPIETQCVRRRFVHYADEAGLRGEIADLVPHSLRATSAILRYEENGKDAVEIQRWLRHANLRQTGDYLKKRKKPSPDLAGPKVWAKYGNL